MFFIKKNCFIAVFACLFCFKAKAQIDSSITVSPVTINKIIITGNKKTKSYVILRELTFKEGDVLTVQDLVSKFEYARHQLYNTRLFNDVVVALKGFNGFLADVEINVKERWYIFPLPYFKPVDRNLAAWAEKGYSLDRLNYGLKFSYYNFTGRNDKLKAWLISGYQRQIQLSYEQPYADNTLKHGYSAGFSYAKFKEINAYTFNNQQFFLKADSIPYAGKYLDEQLNVFVGYSYRPAIKTRHSVKLGFGYNKIDSAVTEVNPKYFRNNKRNIYYPELSYVIDYNNSDYVAYPLKGLLFEAGIIKKGLSSDLNLLEIYGKGTRGWQTGKKTYYGLQGFFSLKLPFDQPFYTTKAMGYGDLYLRGLEKYVIDGVTTLMARNTLRREMLSFSLPTYLPSKSHDRIPFKIYLKAYGDLGYVHNKNFTQNSLVNRMLYTAGAGLDIVTLYDVVLRFEYSFNQLGENGLFLHFKNEF